ncbi:MAG: hypothetical protein JXA38_06810 [Methanosarcinaceae archaeon]|nr:hypothetical protein [Methanosarcinaceae archaeon]
MIVIADILDGALIIGFTSAFLFLDIFLKNHLRLEISHIGSDIALCALVTQLSVMVYLITSENIENVNFIEINVLISFILTILWVISLWLPTTNRPKAVEISYLTGTYALAFSTMHLLGIHNLGFMTIIQLCALGVGAIGYLLADFLRKEIITQRFEDHLKETTAYDLIEACRKYASGLSTSDPLQPVVDLIRSAIRNHNSKTTTLGIHALTDLGIKHISKSKASPPVIKHLNSHLYQIGMLAEMENDRTTILGVIDAIGKIGEMSSKYGDEISTVGSLGTMDSMFRMLKEGMKDEDITCCLVDGIGRIAVSSADSRQLNALEKAIYLLREIGINAIPKHHHITVGKVGDMLLGTSKTCENTLPSVDKQIVLALRDMGIKASQERGNGEKPQSIWQIITSLRKLGDLLKEKSLNEVIWALRDIGVVAARSHYDNDVGRIIDSLENLGEFTSEKRFHGSASQSVAAILQISEVLIKEKLKVSTGLAATALARLSRIDELTVEVNDAVFDLGKYRDLEREMYSFFEETYRKVATKLS